MYLRSDRATGRSGKSYIFELEQGIAPMRGLRTRLELTDFECPISYYLFHSENRKLTLRVIGDSSDVTVTRLLTIQNYNLPELITELNSQFATQSDFTFTASYNTQKSRVTFTVEPRGSNSSITEISLISPTTCHKPLGFDLNELSVSSGASQTLTANNSFNLNRTMNIYVESPSFLTGNLDSYGNASRVLHKYQVDRSFGQIIHYQPAIDEKYVLSNENIQNIAIEILDDDGFELNLNGLPFHLSLRFDFVVQEEYLPPDSLLAQLDLKEKLS